MSDERMDGLKERAREWRIQKTNVGDSVQDDGSFWNDARVAAFASTHAQLDKYTENKQVGTCVDCGAAIWFRNERMEDETGMYHPICRAVKVARAQGMREVRQIARDIRIYTNDDCYAVRNRIVAAIDRAASALSAVGNKTKLRITPDDLRSLRRLEQDLDDDIEQRAAETQKEVPTDTQTARPSTGCTAPATGATPSTSGVASAPSSFRDMEIRATVALDSDTRRACNNEECLRDYPCPIHCDCGHKRHEGICGELISYEDRELCGCDGSSPAPPKGDDSR